MDNRHNGAAPEREDFSKIKTSIPIPNLIEVQKTSYERFLQMDLLPNERQDDIRIHLARSARPSFLSCWPSFAHARWFSTLASSALASLRCSTSGLLVNSRQRSAARASQFVDSSYRCQSEATRPSAPSAMACARVSSRASKTYPGPPAKNNPASASGRQPCTYQQRKALP